MLHLLKRHPFPVEAFLRQSVVLTYAFPAAILKPLLPPGLVLDTYEDYAFLAIALVQTEKLRPSFVPAALGRSFFLSGYRLFVRLATRAGSLRGLWILRSDTDSRWMVYAGNLLTHYRYRMCRAEVSERSGHIEWKVQTLRGDADLQVFAQVEGEPALLPPGSPFPNLKAARRFAGPLPYTFDYEAESQSIVRVGGVRREWNPKPVSVHVARCDFLHQEPFCHATPILANAFYIRDVPYRWERGVRTHAG